MKIKLQYAFFAFATLTFGTVLQAQNAAVKESIIKNTNVDFLKDFAKTDAIQSAEAQQNAQQLAKSKGLVIKGYDKEGNYFEVQEIDKNGNIIYYSTQNAGSRKTLRVDNIKSELGLDLNGEGMFVGVWDGGLGLRTHVELVNRVVYKDGSTRTDDHGTHVIGTIASSGTFNRESKGMAPKATVWSNDWNRDTSEMAAQAAEGLLVSNHSYGVDTSRENFHGYVEAFGSYDFSSYRFDMIAFNAPYYQPVVAAGNDRQSYSRLNPTKNGNDLLLGASLAKNAIVVAAVNEVPNYTNANQVVMSSFSSFGPTDDFRIKPDISAKGVGVFSTTDVSNTSYATNNGTSMAAPAVAGVMILWQQYATQQTGEAFRSATLRAIMAHTADEAGTTDGPDHKFGWGLLNAKKGIELITNSKTQQALISEETLTQGAVIDRDFTVTAAGEKLTATIAWTDSPRPFDAPYAEYLDDPRPALNNDLDLRVFKDDVEFFPWKLNKNFNSLDALKGDNDVDNIEKIEIPNAAPGNYRIVVSHKGQLATGQQDFSIVLSANATLSIDKKVKLESEIRIWPNPAKDFITIDGSAENLKDAQITLFDVMGKEILRFDNSNSESSSVILPVSYLPTGVYFIKFKNAQGQITKKILVNK